MTKTEKTALLGELMSEFGDYLVRLCFLFIRDEHAAQDIVQETFIKFYFKYDSFRGDCSEKTYLTRIAVNNCKDHLKKRKRQAAVFDTLAENYISQHNGNAARDSYGFLTEMVASLKPKEREVILLHYYSQITVKEVARALSMTESAVSTRLHRAKKSLKEMMGERYNEN